MAIGRVFVGAVLLIVIGGAVVVWQGRGADLGRVVYATDAVLIRALPDGDARRVADWPDGASDAFVDPSGRRLAYFLRDEVVVVDLADGTQARLGSRGDRPVGWTPDERLVVERTHRTGSADLIVLVEDGEEHAITPSGLGGIEGELVWFAPDRYAARVLPGDGEDGALTVVRFDESGATVDAVMGDARPLAVLGDLETLAFARAGPAGDDLVLAVPGSDREVTVAEAAEIHGARVGPDDRLAYWGIGTDGTRMIWMLEPGPETRAVTEADVRALEWAPDGSRLVFVDGRMLRTATTDGQTAETVAEGVRPDLLAVL